MGEWLAWEASIPNIVYNPYMNKKVAIERCPSYESETVYLALKRALELAGGLDAAGKTLLLKPNIVFDAAPETAICTHPVFLDAAIRLVRELGAKRILVGDSPGLQTPGFTAKASGLGEVTKKNGAEWVDFTKEKIELPCPEGRALKKFTLTKAAEDADIIINLPKLKTHQLMCFTGAMKNLFGLIPSVAKSSFHVRFPSHSSFAAMIVDLNLALKPVYTFMDAIIGMEGPGPSGGTPRFIGLVLASPNVLALDMAASAIIAYPPGEIPVNKDALGRGIWLNGYGEIEYPGLAPREVSIPDFVKIPLKKTIPQLLNFVLPKPIRKLLEKNTPGPEINHSLCSRCGDCAKICASRAMGLAGTPPKMMIDYRRCIRCFCCHEICSFNAIEIVKRPGNL